MFFCVFSGCDLKICHFLTRKNSKFNPLTSKFIGAANLSGEVVDVDADVVDVGADVDVVVDVVMVWPTSAVDTAGGFA